MRWSDVIELIAQEVGNVSALKIERSIRSRFGGERVTISKRQILTYERVDAAAPGRPKKAAKKLGIHPATAYRVLQKGPVVR